MSLIPADFRVVAPPICIPGAEVELRVPGGAGGNLTIYRLHEAVAKLKIPPGERLRWPTPREDGVGYLLVATRGKQRAVAGLDVSRSWTQFPRYGFLSEFSPEIGKHANARVAQLAEYRLNALQFYDWHWRHEAPVAPTADWQDLARRPISGATVRALVRECHANGMKSMAYNLIYGSFEDGDQHGARREWGLFEDAAATRAWTHPLPSTWMTPRLRVMDPSSTGWRAHLFKGMKAAMTEFGFDGWHADQLGDPGARFTRTGQEERLAPMFSDFLRAAKVAVPGALIFNNVAGYGLDETARAPVDALYVEAWEWTTPDLQALADVVTRGRMLGKQVIIAGYLNSRYQSKFSREKPGNFNPHAMLAAEATVIAAGGWKLSLGDNLDSLCTEYFPHKNLRLSDALRAQMLNYAQFGVAYQNLLRGTDVRPLALETGGDERIAGRATPHKVWLFGRMAGMRRVLHLINLTGRSETSWRDLDGTAEASAPIQNLRVKLPPGMTRAWWASPDGDLLPRELKIKEGYVIVPKLERWTMIYGDASA